MSELQRNTSQLQIEIIRTSTTHLSRRPHRHKSLIKLVGDGCVLRETSPPKLRPTKLRKSTPEAKQCISKVLSAGILMIIVSVAAAVVSTVADHRTHSLEARAARHGRGESYSEVDNEHWDITSPPAAGGVKTSTDSPTRQKLKLKRTRGTRSSGGSGQRQAFKQKSARSSFAETLQEAARLPLLPLLEPMDDSSGGAFLMPDRRRSPANRPIRQTDPTKPNQKCALILHRTYVRKLSNDIDGGDTSLANVEPTGRAERVCITYEDVNEAIQEAKRRRNFKLNDELMEAIQSIEPTPPYISQVGELNLETVKVLKDRFDLSPDEISEGLPLIDMSKTTFWSVCPLLVKPIKCDPTGRFRSFTGHCNNLDNPTWGASQMPFVRYLAPRHPDGIEEFRRSVVGETLLPPVRLVSSSVHRDVDQPSGDLSLFIMVFGQIVDHELTQAAPPRDENGLDFNCCKEQGKSEYCSPILIPENDPLYRKYGQTCMDFKRSLVGLRPNCRLGPRVHINTITPTLDGNTLYGSTKAVSDQLRSFSGGQLKVQNVFKSMKMKPLLPKQTVRPDLDCFERPSNMFCFLAGDDRVNEQPTLTMMHTILVREHNRLASQLSKINSHWNDERIFHETRHLMAAKISAIVQSEYLPMLIGKQLMEANNLTSASLLRQSEYDPEVLPAISQGFTTAAFRQGHTFIQGQLRLHDSRSFKFIESISLRHLFKRPFHYYNPGQLDKVMAGALNTPAQSYDPFITQEIAGHLFQEPGEEFGMDLISINLQRGREQGVPGYVAFRERFTQLPKVRTFEDLLTTMSNRTVHHYSRLYKSVHDIDLWSGGVSETPKDGALVGPTFAAIIGHQFSQLKLGDRFWYENGNQPSSFTSAQLREIRKSSLARLLCINSDDVQLIQRKALKLPHQIFNPLMSCKDLDDIDLRYWKEDPNTPGQFLE